MMILMIILMILMMMMIILMIKVSNGMGWIGPSASALIQCILMRGPYTNHTNLDDDDDDDDNDDDDNA